MSDNVTLNSGSGGATIATDDDGTAQHQYVKVEFGGDGTFTKVATTAGLPVANDSSTFAVSAAQSGTWNITNVSGTVSLPTGAATAAKQPALGTAGTASADVISVQGIASMTALVVDGSGVTQPVSDAGGSLTVDNAALSVTGGGVEASALRVTLASDSTGVVSVDDNGGTLTVDNAALSVTGGGVEASALRVTLASDSTGVLSVDDNGGSLTVDGTVTVAGAAAHDAAISGNPTRVAGRAVSSDITAVATGDTTDLIADLNGKQVVLPYSIPENFTSGATAAITGTTSTSVIAAPGAGIRLYVTSLLVTNSHATVSTLVTITDGSGGTTLYAGNAQAAGGGFAISLPTPLRLTANTALHAVCGTTGSNVYVSASAYKAP